MGSTIIEKIPARASGQQRVAPGAFVIVACDTVVLIDSNFFPVYWRDVAKLENPDRLVVAFDHSVPAPDRAAAAAHVVGRAFVRQFGIKRFYDVGGDQGIGHVIVADRAYALPGTLLVAADSHTGAAGAFNCAARGIGVDVIHAAITGKTWFRVSETIRYDLTGSLARGVSAKDVFLHLAGTRGDHAGYTLEFGGPALGGLGIDARRTLSTMGTELNAEFTVFDPDDELLAYVRARNPAPFEPQYPDADATYADRRVLDLGAIVPLVARPGAMIGNTSPVDEVAGTPIHQAFIGSCANGNFDDLASAARVVAGRQVAPGVRFLVTPGSQAVYRRALAAGHIATLVEAGAVVTNATCGACGGGHLGVLGPKETCITASTRNFRGRMGDPSAEIFMASPATVAASAIVGVITHPGEFLKEGHFR